EVFRQLLWSSILLLAIALGAYFACSRPSFLSTSNYLVIASFLSEVAIITAGEVMLMICGEIDLSVGFVAALAPFVMYFTWSGAGIPLWVAIIGALVVSAGIGLVEGLGTGVNVNRVKIANFMLCSVLGGLAGTLLAFRVSSIDPLAGGYDIMFRAVSAAVIGGTALAGGSGTVSGGLIGALVLAILLDGF